MTRKPMVQMSLETYIRCVGLFQELIAWTGTLPGGWIDADAARLIANCKEALEFPAPDARE